MAPPPGFHIDTYGEADLTETGVAEHWRALWEESPQRSPLTSLAYARAICAAFPVQWTLHAVIDDTGRWQAGCITYQRHRGPFTQAVMPPYTPYAPLICAAPLDASDVHQQRDPLHALLAHLGRHYDHLSLHLHPSLTDVRPALWLGWTASPLYTYRLHLAPDADPLRPWSQGTRRAYRRNRDQYQVHETEDGIEALIELTRQSFAKNDRRLPLGTENVRTFLHHLQAAQLVRIFVAEPSDGPPEAAAAFLHDGASAYYWVAGSIPGPSMTVLLGTVLSRLHEEGVTTFDFVGANTPSFAEFKRRFGGTLLPFYHLEAVPNRWLHLYYNLRTVIR